MEQIINNSNKECIYIFDFDDTIVNTTSFIYIFEKDNEGNERLVHQLTPNEYYEYDVQPNQRIDYGEFDNDMIPDRHLKFNMSIVNIMKEAIEAFGIDSVHICSARVNSKPIQNIIETHLKLVGLKIAAVGYHGTGINSTPINALRKRDYIQELILREKPKYIYFYDDNIHNIMAVKSLNELEYIKEICKILTIHVTDAKELKFL